MSQKQKASVREMMKRLSLSSLDAPVPKGLEYSSEQKIAFTSAQQVEQDFEWNYGAKISKDYLEKFKAEFDGLSQFLFQYAKVYTEGFRKKGQKKSKKAVLSRYPIQCSVIDINLHIEKYKNKLYISRVVVRPCAERHGFYKESLWRIQECVKHYHIKELIIEDVNEKNLQILTKMGFLQSKKTSGSINCYIFRSSLLHRTEEMWNRPKYYPTSDFLNDERLVNQYFDSFASGGKWDIPKDCRIVPDKLWFQVMLCDYDSAESPSESSEEEDEEKSSSSDSTPRGEPEVKKKKR